MKLLYPLITIVIISGCTGYKSTKDPVKSEFETRISVDEFPEQALGLLETELGELPSPSFYKESEGSELSYEVKFESDGYLYSIEFNENGALQDIEKLVDFGELDDDVYRKINRYLNRNYDSHTVIRTQVQFKPNENNSSELIRHVLLTKNESTLQNFEIEIEGKSKTELGYFEFLFNKDGDLIQKRRIQKRSIDNIW